MSQTGQKFNKKKKSFVTFANIQNSKEIPLKN